MTDFIDYYALLQVHPLADVAVIDKAHRVLIARHHPDVGGDTSSAQMLNRAKDVLTDREQRSRYDVEWRARVGSAFLGGEPAPSGSLTETVVIQQQVVIQVPSSVKFDNLGRQVAWDSRSMRNLHIARDGAVCDDRERRLCFDPGYEPHGRYFEPAGMDTDIRDMGRAAAGLIFKFGKGLASVPKAVITNTDNTEWPDDYWRCSCNHVLPVATKQCGFCGDRHN